MEQKTATLNSVVIVAHNNLDLTRKTLRSAVAQDMPVEVTVIDNASSDGTLQWGIAAASKYENVVYSRIEQQKSLAACWNLGLKGVWRRGGDRALVLNNDVIIHPITYRTLLVQGGDFVTTVSVDNEAQFDVDVNREVYSRRPHPNFSGFMITRNCWDHVGPFNEAYYPAYCEDAEYHVRMHRMGFRATCIDLPMLHLGNGANTLRFADPAEAHQIRRGADANRDRFLEKYGCKPGEPAYEELFSDATFGIDKGNR